MGRKLVTVQKVEEIIPIEGADAIELARVMGWQCVVKKGEFQVGDLGIYFEVDSFLPVRDCYEFLRKSSYRENPMLGQGFRIKTVKLRGQLSQGLLLSLSASDFIKFNSSDEESLLFPGADWTELLEVKKWELPEVQGFGGNFLGGRPYGIPTSDEIRIQSSLGLLDQLHNKPYYITTKMDGTSGTVYYIDGKIGCCSRNREVKEEETALYWKPVYKYGLREKLIAYGKPIVLIGEICGPGIQKNRLMLSEPEWFVFDVIDWSKGVPDYLPYEHAQAICNRFGVQMVPVEDKGYYFNYSLNDLLEMAKGKYPSGLDKEGIVVRDAFFPKGTSFKVLNNDALLKEKD